MLPLEMVWMTHDLQHAKISSEAWTSPWYNHPGWLGIKKTQVTYSIIYQTLTGSTESSTCIYVFFLHTYTHRGYWFMLSSQGTTLPQENIYSCHKHKLVSWSHLYNCAAYRPRHLPCAMVHQAATFAGNTSWPRAEKTAAGRHGHLDH